MAQGASTTPSGGNAVTPVARNIIVSVTSTVLGATIIYFLGFHKPKPDSFLEVKEATTSAWKSYIAYENTYTKNTLSYEKAIPETGLDPYLEGFRKESAKLQKDVGELIKRKGIDKDLVTALNRRLENEKALIPKYDEYLANIKRILADSTAADVKKNNYVAEETRWLNYYKGAFERAINDLQEIGKTLSERYNQPFSMNDFMVVQTYDQRVKAADSMINAIRNMNTGTGTDTSNRGKPASLEYAKNIKSKDIIGKWNADGAVISILKNGKLSWIVNTEDKAAGTWKLENDKLKMDVVIEKTKKKFTWSFQLAQIATESFTMVTDGENKLTYYLVRIPN